MTGPADLYRYQALLMPWGVRDLSTFAATGSAWYDGDTFNALIDRGGGELFLAHVRCAGYDAPEITGATKADGQAAAAYARTLAEAGMIVWLDSDAFTRTREEDNFGRPLAFVTLPDGRDLATVMLDAGQAVPA